MMLLPLPFIPGENITRHATYDDLVASWPTAGITIDEIGLNQGNPSGFGSRMIYRMRAGNPSAPTVLVAAGTHGAHEWRTPESVPRFLSRIANPSGPAAEVLAFLADSLNWVVLPCVNPHAYAQSWTLNARNVNINRNFGVGWAEFDDTGSVGSKGAAPFSEIETQYVRDVALEVEPVVAVDYHTWGGFDSALLAGVPGGQMTFWREVQRLLNANTPALPWTIQTSAVPPQPTAASWFGSLEFNGRRVMSCTPEAGSLLSEEDQDAYVQNTLLLIGVKAVEYARTGHQSVFGEPFFDEAMFTGFYGVT